MPELFTKDSRSLWLNRDRCKGCNLCLEVCPVKALDLSREPNKRGILPPAAAPKAKCNFCTLCEYMCPDLAIYIANKADESA